VRACRAAPHEPRRRTRGTEHRPGAARGEVGLRSGDQVHRVQGVGAYSGPRARRRRLRPGLRRV